MPVTRFTTPDWRVIAEALRLVLLMTTKPTMPPRDATHRYAAVVLLASVAPVPASTSAQVRS